MNKLLCTAALLALTTASGCTLYFGGDDNGDDVICADEAAPQYGYRDPQTGSCDYYGGGGGCYGEPTPVAQPDWATCPGACEGLDEQTCEATSGCRAAYLEDDYNCPPGADCPVSYAFWGCWGTAPTGPIQGACDGLDAQSCSEHDDCTATYDTVYNPDGTTTTQFAYCQQETYAPGCYSNADCPAGYECNAGTNCYPPPGCDPTTGEACPDICYGQCVPAQNGCDTLDCGPGPPLDLCPVGHVALDGDRLGLAREPGRDRVERPLATGGEDELRALLGRGLGGRQPDPARRAGDDDHLVGQLLQLRCHRRGPGE